MKRASSRAHFLTHDLTHLRPRSIQSYRQVRDGFKPATEGLRILMWHQKFLTKKSFWD